MNDTLGSNYIKFYIKSVITNYINVYRISIIMKNKKYK